MSMYPFQSLIAVILFSLVHLFANKARRFDSVFRGRFLSMGSGLAIAYVFVDILPKLSKHAPLVTEAVRRFFPYFERHVYVIALLGFLLFFLLDRSKIYCPAGNFFYLSISSYALLNLLIGYAVADIDNPEVRPLVLFTIAIALHYFVNDFSLTESLGTQYDHSAKWILITCLVAGWLVGEWFKLSAAAVALVSAFIGGGIIMNVTRHELSKEHLHSLPTFLLGALGYTVILLMIG